MKILLVVLFFWSLMAHAGSATTRPEAVAGMFYPGDPTRLGREVDRLLEKGKPIREADAQAKVVGLIAPHAGYQYSGQTAAIGFRSLGKGPFDRVYFLGVDHRSGLPTVSIWPEGAFRCPLGEVPVDATASVELMKRSPRFAFEPDQHTEEHSLEVMLPFYLRTMGSKPAVFISVGGHPQNGIELGQQLVKVLAGFSGRTLIVASTDWSHFHSASEAKILDDRGIKTVLAVDPDRLLTEGSTGVTELCGLNGVLALLTVMKAAGGKGVLLDQSDSSMSSGDAGRVVGYASILFEAPGFPKDTTTGATAESATGTQGAAGRSAVDRPADGPPTGDLSAAARKEALTGVRRTLETVLAGKPRPKLTFSEPIFGEPRGAFVTLKKHGELRGCIGLIEALHPLGETLQEMGIAAALQDTRFDPVTADELKDIDLEISVLSPMYPVTSFDEINVGRDGLLLRQGGHSGLFLPQVAPEWGWDRDTFLNQLCGKAGLPPGSHLRPDAKLSRFTAEVFGEKE